MPRRHQMSMTMTPNKGAAANSHCPCSFRMRISRFIFLGCCQSHPLFQWLWLSLVR